MERQQIRRTNQPDRQQQASHGVKPPLPAHACVHSIVQLQRTIGNQSVQSLFRSHALQAKLSISRPDDVYEQEADHIADQVMLMPDPGLPRTSARALERESVPDRFLQNLGLGRPLDASTRAFFEPRFDHDFSQVRVHADAKAADSAQALNAMAYTVGQDIVFRSGAFRPETADGKHLLAHELAHVRQRTSLSSPPLVHRYEGPEHQDIGDRYLGELLAFLQTDAGVQWAQQFGFNRDDLVAQIQSDPMQNGARIRLGQAANAQMGGGESVTLTPGDVIALMGDFYATVEDLELAPASEIRGILDIMQGERAGTVPDANQRYEEITGGRYLTLAQKNDTHFARLNQAEWRRLHLEAITAAQAAGQQNEEAFQRALLIDAAAGHFLTDAYAAGHLFDKSEVLAAITLHLSTHTAITRNPQMQTYVGIVAFAGKLPQLVLKNIHDRMNREGFQVSNARGMRWRTFGDSFLEVAQETQRIAALAVFLSRQQIYAARSGQSPNPDDVQGLMPNDNSVQLATLQAIAYIPDAVAEVEGLIYRNRSLAPSQFGSVLGAIVQSNLETIGHPGREREIEQMLESARRRGDEGGVVAPSFTILSWP